MDIHTIEFEYTELGSQPLHAAVVFLVHEGQPVRIDFINILYGYCVLDALTAKFFIHYELFLQTTLDNNLMQLIIQTA